MTDNYPKLHVKGDPEELLVTLLHSERVFRFVCTKHRRNLVHADPGNRPTLVPINRTSGYTGAYESEKVEGITLPQPILWDIDLSQMFCPENKVDNCRHTTLDECECDCADHYRVMTEVMNWGKVKH